MIERQGTSAQQHWSKFVKYLAAIFEGIKNAGFLGGLFSSTFGFGGDESSGGIMISEISEPFFGFFLFFSRLFIASKSLEGTKYEIDPNFRKPVKLIDLYLNQLRPLGFN